LILCLSETKKFQPSQSFANILENLKFPGSAISDGSHFLYYHDNKLFVLSDLKKWYNMMGRYVLVLDLQSDTVDYIDLEVSRFCPLKDGFIALEHDPKSPGTKFNTLDMSSYQWVHTSIPPLSQRGVKYPVLLTYSNLLLVLSGSYVQVLELTTKQWFVFELSTSTGTIQPALSTNYAILGDQFFLCYAETAELYCADMQQIIDAVMVQSQPASDLKLCLSLMLRPVNCIFVHEDVLVALYIMQDGYDRFLNRAWYYSGQCDHWHNITTCDPYIDGQWFMMETGKLAVAKLSSSWNYVWRTWSITAKIYQVQLETEYL